jgi:hypothetical protein
VLFFSWCVDWAVVSGKSQHDTLIYDLEWRNGVFDIQTCGSLVVGERLLRDQVAGWQNRLLTARAISTMQSCT